MTDWRKRLDVGAIKSLVAEGLNAPQIAERLGCSRNAIYLIAKKQDIGLIIAGRKARQAPAKSRKPNPGHRIQRDSLLAALKTGISTASIAARFGVMPPAVIRACHRHGFSLPGRPQKLPPADAPEKVAISAATDSRLTQLIATGGRYSDLANWAARWKRTSIQARTEWARLGLALERRPADD